MIDAYFKLTSDEATHIIDNFREAEEYLIFIKRHYVNKATAAFDKQNVFMKLIRGGNFDNYVENNSRMNFSECVTKFIGDELKFKEYFTFNGTIYGTHEMEYIEEMLKHGSSILLECYHTILLDDYSWDNIKKIKEFAISIGYGRG